MPRHPAPSCFQLGTRPSLVELSLISPRRNHRLRCSTHLELSSTRKRFARNSRVQGPPRQRRSHTCTRTPLALTAFSLMTQRATRACPRHLSSRKTITNRKTKTEI